MRIIKRLLVLFIAALLLTISWSIVMDLALYLALADELGDSSMRVAIRCIDKTEPMRAMSLIIVLMLWSAFVLCVDKVFSFISLDKVLSLIRRKREVVIQRSD